MTKKTRTILFLSFVILFLLVAPLIVFYSLGWRLDWSTKKIIQPGIFYFKAWPKNVQIYLDGEPKKKTDFFFGSVLVENLLPKKYDVEIKKEGFQGWKKTLEIKEREVTEAKNVVLIPENPSFTVLVKKIEDFFFSPDEEKIILKEKSGSGSSPPGGDDNISWDLKLFELKKSVKSRLIEKKDISQEKVELLDLKFSPDSKRVLLKVRLKEKLAYYILEIDKTPPALSPLDFLGPDVEDLYFHPQNLKKLFALLASTEKAGPPRFAGEASDKEGIIVEADLVLKTISLPYLENIAAFETFGNAIYYLDSSGFLFKTDFVFGHKEKINENPFLLKLETEHKLAFSNSHIFLKEGEILYIFNRNKKSFEKLFEPVKDFRFSPDSRKLVYFSDYEIWLLYLGAQYDQPQKWEVYKVFLTRFSEKIDKVFWWNNYYLLFSIGNKTKIAEIDDRDRTNIANLAEFSSIAPARQNHEGVPKIFWSLVNKKLYILTGESLYVSEKLTP